MQTRTLTLGHSPDPDDAFMFYGLAKELIPTGGFRFEHILQDIQTLNERATRGELDISAISIHAYAYVSDKYALLPSGASMGDGYGPMLVARQKFHREEIAGLKKRLAELEAELALLPDPEEARQTAAILKETQKNLTEALNVAEVLRRQNEALRSRTAAPRQEAGPQVDDVQKELLSTRVAMQVAQSELATLRGELAVLQLALAARGTNVADRPGSGRLRPVDDARLALANDRVPDAIRVLNAETASSPENAEAWYLLGRSLGLTGDLAGAERALARTLELAPGSAVTHFELARLHQRRNPNDHGIPRWHYHKAVSLGYPRDAAFEQAIQWEQPAGPK
jgi:tetratricopeptide (TPR) repeat protein